MKLLDSRIHDVMQVCRNGHVITDLLDTFPERALAHCDRCGAVTLDHCLTCGLELPGAVYVPEAPPVGNRPPPEYCSGCGAPFPWTHKTTRSAPSTVFALENLLRRLPLVARQLRVRYFNRVPFRIEDDHDLADLLRALLPLQFEQIYPEQRTPRYALSNQTDFILGGSGTAIVAKRITSARRESALLDELREDLSYYQSRSGCGSLLAFAYDPETLLHDPRRLEMAWAALSDALPTRAVIAS
jgi:hypothetical protein